MKYEFLGIFALALILLLSGCTAPTTGQAVLPEDSAEDEVGCTVHYISNGTGCCLDKNDNKLCDGDETPTAPNWISNFNAYSDKCNGQDCIMFYFSLLDSTQKEMAYPGTINIKIKDDKNKVLYQKDFKVSRSEFWEAEIGITKVRKLIWSGQILVKDIKKTMSGSSGSIEGTFETGGIEFEPLSAHLFSVPTVSERELIDQYEQEYQESAILINESQQRGNFTLTITKAGWFNARDSLYREDEIVLRYDLEVTNERTSEQYFFTSDIALIDNKKNQYDPIVSLHKNAFDSGEIFPGITRKGFIAFEGIKDDATSATIYADCGMSRVNYQEIKCIINVPIPGRTSTAKQTNNQTTSNVSDNITPEPPVSVPKSNSDNTTAVSTEKDLDCSDKEILQNGQCVYCGGENEPPCTSGACSFGYELIGAYCTRDCGFMEIRVSGSCAACGQTDQACCEDNYCVMGSCIDGICRNCGRGYQNCCPGESCLDSGYVCSLGTCVPCGTYTNECCSGNWCEGTVLYCDESNTCQMCGGRGNECCEGDLCAIGTCVSGFCE